MIDYVSVGCRVYKSFKNVLSRLLPNVQHERFKGLQTSSIKKRKTPLSPFAPKLDSTVHSYLGSLAHTNVKSRTIAEEIYQNIISENGKSSSDDLLLLCAMAQLSHNQSYLVGQWLDPITCDLVATDEKVRDF